MLEVIPGVARLELRKDLRVGRVYRATPTYHRDQYVSVHGEGLSLIGDPRFALVVIHYPIPHEPFIWDRESDSFRIDNQATYQDNLALADRTLDGLMASLQESGLASKTTVVVTADHWRRTAAGESGPRVGDPRHRVPFLVRFPGQITATPVPRRIRTTLLRDLVRHMLAGDITDATEAAAWLAGSGA
jgi:hypothetical protein